MMSESELSALEEAMKQFYMDPPSAYHESALATAKDWTKPEYVFHRRIVALAHPKSEVLDVGCGPAESYGFFHERGAHYTGADVAREQLRANELRCPGATFLCLQWRDLAMLGARYDVVTSFFTLEHVVYPREFLAACASAVRPGGVLAILCPNFLERGYLPSQHFFGSRPGGLRAKLKRRLWAEVVRELFDRYIVYPVFLRRARKMARREGAWVINLRPVCLEVREWARDWDAVYMVSEDEVANYLTGLGLTLVERGTTWRRSARTVAYPDFCYVVCRKE